MKSRLLIPSGEEMVMEDKQSDIIAVLLHAQCGAKLKQKNSFE
jgi:hypothetical protein